MATPKTPRTIEDWLAHLKKLELPRDVDELRRVLALDRPAMGVAIASAARLAAEFGLHMLARDLAASFKRLTGDVKRDPVCRGKTAIARCLHDLDIWEEDVFVAGMTIVQREGFEQLDSAAELRAICALAHAHFLRPDALDVIATLLADNERVTRVGAAQALGESGHRDAAALLRYKLLAVPDEFEVLSACCEALLVLAPDSHAFLCGLLEDHDDRAEAAALALGGARVAVACEPLIAWCNASSPDRRRRAGYLAVALLRDDTANAFLVEAIGSRAKADALAAARALATFKDHAPTRKLLENAIASVKDAALRRELGALIAD